MPLTPNRKIDRKALPDPAIRVQEKPAVAHPKQAAPRRIGATQTAIAQVWTGLLGVRDIGAEDNFFALGGHSLLAVQAHRDIKAALGDTSLTITDIFRFPTLGALAAHLDREKSAPAVKSPAIERQARQVDRTRIPPELPPHVAAIVEKRRAMRTARRKADA